MIVGFDSVVMLEIRSRDVVDMQFAHDLEKTCEIKGLDLLQMRSSVSDPNYSSSMSFLVALAILLWMKHVQHQR